MNGDPDAPDGQREDLAAATTMGFEEERRKSKSGEGRARLGASADGRFLPPLPHCDGQTDVTADVNEDGSRDRERMWPDRFSLT